MQQLQADELLDQLPEGLMIVDPSGAVLYLNAAARSLLGYDVKDGATLHLRDVCGSDWQEISDKMGAITGASGAGWSTNLHDRAGRTYWADTNMKRLADGNVAVCFRAVQTDPWVDPLPDSALSKHERDFRLLVDLFPEPAWLCDQSGDVVYCNPAWLAYTGQTPAKARGRGWVRALHPADFARVAAVATRTMFTGAFFDITYRLRRADGQYRWQHVRSTPFRDGKGRVARWFGTCVDVDDQVRAREALQAAVEKRTIELREREERLSVLFEEAPDAYFLISPDGAIAAVNRAAEELTGRVRQDLVGAEAGIAGLPVPEGGTAGLRRSGRFRDAAAESRDIVVVRPDGERCEAALRTVQLRVGGKAHTLMVARDVSERRQLEREFLRVSDQERERIGRELHDGLCQQLAGINYLLDFVGTSVKQRPEEAAATVRRAEQLLSEAIEQVRHVSAGLAPVNLSDGGLATALAEVALRMDGMNGIACRFGGNGVSVPDGNIAGHLYRIAQQAVRNAYEHAKPSTVTIELTDHADAVTLTVCDDGIGLAPDAGQGRGLGLQSMAYRAHLIHAALDISRESPRGTRVVCRVPRSAFRAGSMHDASVKKRNASPA